MRVENPPRPAYNSPRRCSRVEERRKRLVEEWLRMKRLIQRHISPRRIILFGSFARGEISQWSDIDLVIIEETDKPFFERIREALRIIKPRVGIDLLIYTPEEIERAAKTSRFIREEILEKGRVIMGSFREEGLKWLEFAREDIRMAELAMGEGIYNQVCFHAQQCVEKSLKAILAAEGRDIPRTHKVVDLIPEVNAVVGEDLFERFEGIEILDQYYIPTRYPDAVLGVLPEGMPGEREAAEALEFARGVWRYASDRVKAAG